MGSKQLDFEFESARKNTRRFQGKTFVTQVVGTLYVQKALFDGQTPKKLRMIEN